MGTPDVLSEIVRTADALCDILEASALRGLKHPRHSRHVAPARRRLLAILQRYFDSQRKAVLADLKPRIRAALASFPRAQEAASAAGNRFAHAVLPASVSPLSFAVTGNQADEWDEAITEMIDGAAEALASQMGLAEVPATADIASTFLRNNSLSNLTGNLSGESTQQLRDALANAWDAGGSYEQMVQAVEQTFEDFSEYRAGMIAQTEVTDGYAESREAIARSVGYDEKSWETESGNPCEVCLANEGEGWIGIDDDFSSGDSAPSAHPWCQCVLNFRQSVT